MHTPPPNRCGRAMPSNNIFCIPQEAEDPPEGGETTAEAGVHQVDGVTTAAAEETTAVGAAATTVAVAVVVVTMAVVVVATSAAVGGATLAAAVVAVVVGEEVAVAAVEEVRCSFYLSWECDFHPPCDFHCTDLKSSYIYFALVDMKAGTSVNFCLVLTEF